MYGVDVSFLQPKTHWIEWLDCADSLCYGCVVDVKPPHKMLYPSLLTTLYGDEFFTGLQLTLHHSVAAVSLCPCRFALSQRFALCLRARSFFAGWQNTLTDKAKP